VNAYERNPKARKDCIKYYGATCSVCDFNFADKYGNVGAGFIHVHHLKPLAEAGEC
jgi:5-methylcytosine-specific restriction enzyme A